MRAGLGIVATGVSYGWSRHRLVEATRYFVAESCRLSVNLVRSRGGYPGTQGGIVRRRLVQSSSCSAATTAWSLVRASGIQQKRQAGSEDLRVDHELVGLCRRTRSGGGLSPALAPGAYDSLACCRVVPLRMSQLRSQDFAVLGLLPV